MAESKPEQLESILLMMQEQMAQQRQMLEMMIRTRASASSDDGATTDSEAAHKIPKAKAPVAHLEMSESKWNFFISEWERYKRSTNQKDKECQDQLIDACEEELREDMFKTLGKEMWKKPEVQLLKEIKKLTVKCQSKQVNRHKLQKMMQVPGEQATQFLARLRGQAALCETSCEKCNSIVRYEEDIISDQLVRGLASAEIQEEVLARGAELTTQSQIIDFISAKECARVSHDALTEEHPDVVAIGAMSAYQRQKRSMHRTTSAQKEQGCHGCGSSAHGHTFLDRKAKCPVWGKRCPRCNGFGHLPEVVNCKPREKQRQVTGRDRATPATQSAFTVSGDAAEAPNDMCDDRASFLSVVLGGISSGEGKVPHLVHDDVKGWVKSKPSELPCVTVTVELLPDVHEMVGHGLCDSVTSAVVRGYRAVADTGAQTTAAGPGLMKSLSLSVCHLLPVSQAIQTADGVPIEVLGAMCIRVLCGDSVTDQLCYVTKSCPGH